MKYRRSMMWAVLFALFLIAGCGQQATPSQPETPVTPGSSVDTPSEPSMTTETISVFYADGDLLELQEEKQEISFTDDLDKYKKAIALLESPQDQDKHFPLWSDFHYHSVVFEDGQVTIDADSQNIYNLGANGEGMALEALLKTLFQFPEVESIVILEDGQQVETLMGHVEIEKPFTRE
ncbi:GerMN domain-containing protein [Brevibacillus sp. TJ4]|uniref:GerMN domain-containing protein n=1 Tax=Brevibacillus sp. TJ4 TaxID=3234853 RepID=UPI003BA09F3F